MVLLQEKNLLFQGSRGGGQHFPGRGGGATFSRGGGGSKC